MLASIKPIEWFYLMNSQFFTIKKTNTADNVWINYYNWK
jgi:hypothetical protein